MFTITFHGHACVELSDGTFDIIFDPFITGNPLTTARWERLSPDAILLSHGHADHVGDAVPISRRTGALIIAPFELAAFCARSGAPNTHAMHIGGSRTFPFGTVKLTPALHGSGFVDGETSCYTGNPCGYLVTFAGRTIYFAGDTGLFSDMKMIGEMSSVDIAFLPIGDNFTMGPADAAVAGRWLGAKIVVPIHYNTWPVIEQDPRVFKKTVEGGGGRCLIMAPNTSASPD